MYIGMYVKIFLKKVARGVEFEPGSSRFNLFSHLHHFTPEPHVHMERLPEAVFSAQPYIGVRLTLVFFPGCKVGP
jgi:hypothetical protein